MTGTRPDNLRIEVDGKALTDLHCDLISLEVELDEELAGMFRLTLALRQKANGSWLYLDDPRFAIWRSVAVTAGLKGNTRRLVSGYITHLRPDFGAGLEQCRVAVWGMDASVLMDREDRLKDWPGKSDSDIATEVFSQYKLTPKVTRTEVIHDDKVSTIIQRETDIRLLKRLALRNGFECFIDGDTGYFRPPAVDDAPQPVLAIQFGKDTNINKLRLAVNALTPTTVTMTQLDRATGRINQTTVDTSKQTRLGARPAGSYLNAKVRSGGIHIGQTVTTGQHEMDVLCQSLFDQGEWFVTGEGEVSANRYGSVLMPRATVTVKGVGAPYSGVYYVSHVTHRFTATGYTQLFRIKRNALMPTGTENFRSGGR
ncbi:phage late control D family protein [Dactylosporangium sp. NPDC051541]|uniref:phage late control D family protein n=1 Tax=Dactylosporangium sp. NPDC051541 TaxID=3363977 RepID=UPI003796EAB2